ELVRIDAQGTKTTVGTGFTVLAGMAFGPDGALYVSEFANDRIVRVAPEPVTTTTTSTMTTTTSTSSMAPTPTTTPTTSTSSSTAPTPTTTSTTTTRPPGTTTTTTLVGCDGIPDGPTFASIDCRLIALLARVNAASELEDFGPKLAHSVDKARQRNLDGQSSCLIPKLKKTKKRLQQAGTALTQYTHRLNGLAARKRLDDAVRTTFLEAGGPIERDVTTLRGVVACPGDAM